MLRERRSIVAAAYAARFGESPDFLVRAPGRVNLIGEHTDYNDGFVMPLAIEQSLYIAGGPSPEGSVEVHSLDLEGSPVRFDLADFEKGAGGWGEYLKGVAWVLRKAGFEPAGWRGVISSEVPIGAGLSSSAAFELGTALAFQAVSGFDWDPVQMARLGRKVENEWIGVNSGIMDQLIIALAEAGAALRIDCRSFETVAVPIPAGVRVVIIDSATRRGASGLADSAYNDRRAECEKAAKMMGRVALRDAGLADLEGAADRLPEVVYRRARHVITENARVKAAAEAMRAGDLKTLGNLLRASHKSMRDDFEITREEIDTLVAIANAHPACIGARMTGGGFGGCVVALVHDESTAAFRDAVGEKYFAEVGLKGVFYETGAVGGAAVL